MAPRKKSCSMYPQVMFYCCSNCLYQTTHDSNARRHIDRTCTNAQMTKTHETMLAWTSNDEVVRAVEAGHPGIWGRVDRLEGVTRATSTHAMPPLPDLHAMPLRQQVHEIFKRLNCG